MILRIRRWFYSWHMFARAVHMARAKKRGAGTMPWVNAIKMGHAYRFMVYGQFYDQHEKFFRRMTGNKTNQQGNKEHV